MTKNHSSQTSNDKRLASLDNIIELWQNTVFFFAHIGFSQWDVEAKPKRAQLKNLPSKPAANTRE
jgi:hypothetical protein